MGVDVIAQGRALLQALALGVCAGGLYDGLRILRVRINWRIVGHLLDFLFWIAVTVCIFVWSQGAWGGNIRAYGIIFLFIGGWGYFLLISPLILRFGYMIATAIQKIMEVIFFPVHLLLVLLKKFQKIAKNIFPFAQIWYKIKEIISTFVHHKMVQTKSAEGGRTVEHKIWKIRHSHEDCDPDVNHLTVDRPFQSAWGYPDDRAGM